MKKKVFIRSLSVLMSLLMLLIVFPAAGAGAFAFAAATTHKNLVVVVRFSDDTTGDGSTGLNAPYSYNSYYTYWQQFKSWFAGTNIPYFDNATTSLAGYMSAVSNGVWNVVSYFPQSSEAYTDTNPNNTNADKTVTGKTLTYITLPHNKSYYEGAGDLQVIIDTAAIFNANTAWTSGASDWGSNNTLDNLELVVQVASEPETTDTLMWPHKADASGAVSLGGMKVFEYNFVNSKAVSDAGTVKHEYMHSAGLGDLYRVGDTSSNAGPVGVWDIMGSAAGQFPLAQSLVDIGFETADSIKTVTGSGTRSVTLHTHYSTADDGQAVKVYSPYSADEYFVFEYRQKSKDILSPDYLVPSSGLIVYRVDNTIEKDVNGHRTNRISENGYYQDSIYVFRPGETGIHDSAGDLQKAALSTSTYAYLGAAANARTSFGSADMTKTITDGAIVDSADRNSGIVVNITGQTADSITFSLSIPDYSAMSLWSAKGTPHAAANADCVSTAVTSDGTVYQSYIDNGTNITFRKLSGGAWTDMVGITVTGTSHAQLLSVGSDLYCAYADYSSSAYYRVAKWTGFTWKNVAGVATGTHSANSPNAAVINGSVYCLVDLDNTGVQLYKLNDNSGSYSLTAVGGILGTIGYTTQQKLCCVGSDIAVICNDLGSYFTEKTGTNMYVYKNGSWTKTYSETSGAARNITTVSLGSSTAVFSGFDSGVTPKLYIVASDSANTVTSYDLTAAGTDIQDAEMFTSGSYIYLTTVDSTGLCNTWYAKISAPSVWAKVGESVMSNTYPGSESVSAFALGSKAYVGAINSSLTSITLLSHDLIAEETKSLSAAEVTLTAASYTYDGTSHKPAVTVTLDGTTVDPAQYTVSCTDSTGGSDTTDAGTVTVTVTAAEGGNYTGTALQTPAYTIVPETPTFNTTALTMVYTGSTPSFAGRVALPSGMTFTSTESYSYKTSGSTEGYTAGLPTAVGSYLVVINTTAGKNFAAAQSDPISFTITERVVTWSDWVSNNNGTHTRTDVNDSTNTETADCTYTSVVTAATCTSGGYTTHTCTVCGYSYKDSYTEKDPNNHAGYPTEVRGAKAATTTEEGYTGDTYCTGCGQLISTGTVIPMIPTVWSDWVSNNNGTHTRTDTSNAEHTDTADCTYTSVVTAATCTAGGYTTHTCTVCGYSYKDSYTEKDPNNHAGYATEVRGAKAATTTEEGYTGDTYCTGCGQLISTGTVIPMIQGNLCPLDGLYHGSTFFGRLILFFHKIAYFFKTLFVKK